MNCPNCGLEMREYGAGWYCQGARIGERGCYTWQPKMTLEQWVRGRRREGD